MVAAAERQRVFSELETHLNRIAAEAGGLEFLTPMPYIEGHKRELQL
jgi:hypothetical protein